MMPQDPDTSTAYLQATYPTRAQAEAHRDNLELMDPRAHFTLEPTRDGHFAIYYWES